MAKNKNKIHISPRGVFMYPCLVKPDYEMTAKGSYHVDLRVSAEEGAPLKEMIDDAYEAHYKAACAGQGKKLKRGEPAYSVDGETNEIIFKFKKNASYIDKDTNETVMTGISVKTNEKVDGKFKDFPEGVDIWSGTVGRVAFTIYPYLFQGKAGVRLNISGVKVLDLVTGGDGNYFGDEDDDYVSENISEADGCADAGEHAEEADGDGDF